MQVTVKFGLNSLTREYEEGTTVGAIVTDPDVQAALGFGENIDPSIEGQVVGNSTFSSHGDLIVVRTKANVKA